MTALKNPLLLTGLVILLACTDPSSGTPKFDFYMRHFRGKAAAPKAGFTAQNAFKGDINNCLFNQWIKTYSATTAVLDSTVGCSTLGSNYKELCYGLNHMAQAQFAVCYDQTKRIPSFTGHLLVPGTGSAPVGRPNFKTDSGSYKPTTQAAVNDYSVNTQVADFGSTFDLNSNHYCAKGHLVPNADYDNLHEAEAALTFILTNAAPQWQKFNGGNWMLLEKDVRTYVNAVHRNVYIFTGTGGVAKSTSGAPYKMNNLVTAPQYYWKLICDPAIKQMVIFVGKNYVGSWSTNKKQGCRTQSQTEERGVMQCDSYDNIKKNTLYSDFKLPKMYNTNCPTATRGTFLDTYTNNFS